MVSIIQTGELLNSDLTPMNAAFAVVVGLSSDQKPTGDSVGNGWIFKEMDTGSEFMYDAANMQWLLQSGGGGESGVLMVTYTIDENDPAIANCDYSFADILSAVNSGKFVYAKMIYGFETILLMPNHIDSDGARFEYDNFYKVENGGEFTLYGMLWYIEHDVDEDSGKDTIYCVAGETFSINL